MLFCNGNQEPITAVVMLAGDAPAADEAARLRQLLSGSEKPLLLAADGGAEHLSRLGLLPDLLLGDGDSLSLPLPQVPRISYPEEKDFSDGEAALDYALRHSAGRVLLLGALGGRLDHLLNNVLLPLHLPGGAERTLLSGPGMEAAYSLGRAEISGQPGDTLSLIPLSQKVKAISLQGFYYPLTNYDTEMGSSRTLSNVLTGERATVNHESGVLLLLHYRGRCR